jgi:hypothetical protein
LIAKSGQLLICSLPKYPAHEALADGPFMLKQEKPLIAPFEALMELDSQFSSHYCLGDFLAKWRLQRAANLLLEIPKKASIHLLFVKFPQFRVAFRCPRESLTDLYLTLDPTRVMFSQANEKLTQALGFSVIAEALLVEGADFLLCAWAILGGHVSSLGFGFLVISLRIYRHLR